MSGFTKVSQIVKIQHRWILAQMFLFRKRGILLNNAPEAPTLKVHRAQVPEERKQDLHAGRLGDHKLGDHKGRPYSWADLWAARPAQTGFGSKESISGNPVLAAQELGDDRDIEIFSLVGKDGRPKHTQPKKRGKATYQPAKTESNLAKGS
jgi:hypothetical protein